ncbi:SRPBCC family protein [Baekduia soli]|uniref:SRPBCC family protein n=1 Tax=Baekduia soli TaxID=496014 RepID=UPI0016529C3A|nr:SRPBCC family protein [Baekduia soli]
MKPITVSIRIDRPRREVFEHLDVLANHLPFCDHFMADGQLSGPASGPGGRLRFRALTPGRGEWMDLEVCEAHAPERIVERTRGAGGRRVTRGSYVLREAGPAATEVEFELVTERAPAHERALAPMARRWLARQNAIAMTRLKAQIEGAAAPVAA